MINVCMFGSCTDTCKCVAHRAIKDSTFPEFSITWHKGIIHQYKSTSPFSCRHANMLRSMAATNGILFSFSFHPKAMFSRQSASMVSGRREMGLPQWVRTQLIAFPLLHTHRHMLCKGSFLVPAVAGEQMVQSSYRPDLTGSCEIGKLVINYLE